MSTDRIDTTTGTAAWDDARDARFFTVTARLFSPAFCLGASVLLASYDDEPGDRREEPVVALQLARRSLDGRATARPAAA
jgi:hypothetical protein